MLIESDDESMRVPEIGCEAAGTSTSGREAAAARLLHGASSEVAQKRRGRSHVDKDNKRLKRHNLVNFPLLFYISNY